MKDAGMKRTPLAAKISLGFWFALTLLVVLSIDSYRTTRVFLDTSQLVAHTHEVIETLEQVLSELTDAETGQRGYLLTGEERYLEPYHVTLDVVDRTVRSLRRLTADNPEQHRRLAKLEPLIAQRLVELQETIDVRRRAGLAAALQIVRTDRGKQIMDNVRTVVQDMVTVERALLKERTQQAEASASTTLSDIFYGDVLAFVLVALSGYFISRDLTKRRQAEQALAALNTRLELRVEERTQALQQSEEAERAQREFFQVTLASIGDAVIVTDPYGEITFLNRVAEVVTGWTTANAAAKPLSEVFHIVNEETRQPVDNPIEIVLRTGGVAGLANHTVLLSRTGSACPIDDSAAPIRDAQGRLLGVILVFRDVSERRRTEKERDCLLTELQQANEEFQQFANIVSHDLNEPLRTIGSFAQLLAQETQGKLDASANESMAFITDAAQRMQQMLTDLLAYTRVGQTPEFQAVDTEALLMQVIEALQLRIAECGGTITYEPLPTVSGDATRLGLVFQNLIGNALKFCGETPPRIHVSAQQVYGYWQFAVRDNGIGIDPKQAERIFQVFQRLHTRSQSPGTGIGLAICKKIIEQHGGRIWVESHPGEGSIFYFTMPQV